MSKTKEGQSPAGAGRMVHQSIALLRWLETQDIIKCKDIADFLGISVQAASSGWMRALEKEGLVARRSYFEWQSLVLSVELAPRAWRRDRPWHPKKKR